MLIAGWTALDFLLHTIGVLLMESRHWLITSTTYGTWLPGDARGFVSNVRFPDDSLDRHNKYGAEYDNDHPRLQELARKRMKGSPIDFTKQHAGVILAQFLETTEIQQWHAHAIAIMNNHFHIVASALETIPSKKILQSYKSYASRALNSNFPRPDSETWWTESGSRRPLRGEAALAAAIAYVLQQQNPLLIWSARFGIHGVSV
jgi:REP element-mobilizing transposase RayT